MISFAGIVGFEWDAGNERKNESHGVSRSEAEEVFSNIPLVVAEDVKHSGEESRRHALGVTDEGRRLHVTFTVRGSRLRVISARDMSRKEREAYGEAAQGHPEIQG